MNDQRLLILKLGAIGDVVLCLPMFNALRAKYPQAHITLMIGRASAPLLQNNPAINELWVVDENDFWKKRVYKLIPLLTAVRARHFQQVYILQWSTLFHAFFWLAGIPERIGFSREGHAFRLTRAIPYYEGNANHHDVDLYLTLAETTTLGQPKPELRLTPPEREEAEARWRTLGAADGRKRVVMAPGGGQNAKLVMPLKRWPLAHFKELAKRFAAQENGFVVLAGSAEEKLLLDGMELPSERNLAGHISLRQTAALIATAQLFIGNDSGLTHIASAVGTPSIAFFGPTSPNGKEARGTAQKILYRQEACSPCYRFGHAPPCPYAVKCLTQISVEDAWKAVEEL